MESIGCWASPSEARTRIALATTWDLIQEHLHEACLSIRMPYMDAIGMSRYLPVVVYEKGRPDNTAYIGRHLESHEKQLGKFWPRVNETTSRNSVSAIQRAVEHIRGLPGPVRKVGVEASFLP